MFQHSEFLTFQDYTVLLPIYEDHRPNISLLRLIISGDGQMLTLFLKDITHVNSPDDEMFFAGRLAVCEKFPGQDFYLTTVYHEWFIIDPVSQ